MLIQAINMNFFTNCTYEYKQQSNCKVYLELLTNREWIIHKDCCQMRKVMGRRSKNNSKDLSIAQDPDSAIVKRKLMSNVF